MKIELKHKKRYQGKYNRELTTCPYCNNDLGFGLDLLEHTIGFAENNGQWFHIAECPDCFKIFNYHLIDEFVYKDWKKLKEK